LASVENERTLLVKPRYILLTVFYCAGIFYLSSKPDPVEMGPLFPGTDKVLHAVLYGGLAAVVSLGVRRSGNSPAPRVQFLAPIVFAGLYGLSDEIHQMFVPSRHFDPFDLIADVAGAVLVQSVLWRWWRRMSA